MLLIGLVFGLRTVAEPLPLVATLLTGFSNGVQRCAVDGNIACVSGTFKTVQFINVKNPRQPDCLDQMAVPSPVSAIVGLAGTFYVSSGAQIIPVKINHGRAVPQPSVLLVEGEEVTKMSVSGRRILCPAYHGPLKRGSLTLLHVDRNGGLHPERHDLGGVWPSDAVARSNLIYVANYKGTIEVLAQGAGYRLVNSLPITAHGDYTGFEPWRILVHGAALYLMDDTIVQVFDLRDPARPQWVRDLHVPRDIECSHIVGNVLVIGYSWLNNHTAGVMGFDLCAPLQPKAIWNYTTGAGDGYYWFGASKKYLYLPSSAGFSIAPLPGTH